MSATIQIGLLEAYSRGEITRHEIEDQTGKIVGFGDLLAGLHKHHLPLPRLPSDPNALGVRLIKQLTENAVARGG